ncbi:MAG: hypothetical protein L0Z50_24690 [Verrucomicrobiales bacterium]|nr:hypothetical protein [Verrucomicrobiales bacterium]
MNVDEILSALNHEQADYLLIGGMNFLLRHAPELTFDVDVWVRDDAANLERLNRALKRLDAAWGPTEKQWAPVPDDWRWLRRQACFCLTTRHGALDVFREVRGLAGRFAECKAAGIVSRTATGVSFIGLSDGDMLASQEALPEAERKPHRMDLLREAIRKKNEAS